MKNISRFKIFILSVSVAIALIVFYTFYNAPKLKYKIEIVDSIEEKPMELSLAESGNALNFSIQFKDKPSAVTALSLQKELKYNLLPPYLYFGDALEIRIKGESVNENDELVSYKITGTIRNLIKDSYRLKMIDANNNLIDEKMFELKLK